MPFEFGPVAPLNIAVIGAGISGMGAAHLLARAHNVTLFEKEASLGGHARTVVAGKNGDQPVDTGFIVFNYANYPRMTRLFEELDVPVAKSNMSFGVSAEAGKVEYALNDLRALIAQKRNLTNPAYYRMLSDILRFNKKAIRKAQGTNWTLGQLLDEMKLGSWFRNYYILPFSGAIWSTSLNMMLDFPAETLLRFFQNHHLLGIFGQHQWYTVDGGSTEYVKRLGASMRGYNVDIRTGASVNAVRRENDKVFIKSDGADWQQFDRVVFACHSDQALAMLETPSPQETELLGAIKYQPNRAILHADPVVMPSHRDCWASWVYTSDKAAADDPVGISYWMNSLQPIPKDDLLIQSLNPVRPIKDELIYEETCFMHPVFDRAALAAQGRIKDIQGHNNTWYCGAYLRNGFHEDGYSSAVDVAEMMGMVASWA